MAVNLSRNTRCYFSTAAVPAAATCFEIQILDGYSFSQSAEQQTIQLSEAGSSPVRGQRAFNTKLNAAEWSLSTYIRPYKATNVKAPESYLWNAMLGAKAIDSTGVTVSTATSSGSATEGYTLAVTTSAAHNLAVGDAVTFTGLTPTALNSMYKVTTVTSSTAIVVDLNTKVAPGTITATGAKAYKGQWVETPAYALAGTSGSDVNQLQEFYLFFIVDNTVYRLNRAAVNQAEVSMDLTGISTIAWSGFANSAEDVTDTYGTSTYVSNGSFTSTYATAFAAGISSDTYITNKLSTIDLRSNIGGAGGTTYTIPITGGSFTYSNNIEYVIPETLGTVNNAIGYYTGTRAISGSLNAYLKTGANESSTLLNNMMAAAANTVETKFYLDIAIGGSSNTTRVNLTMPGVSLQIPSIDIQDVVSTSINFNAQGSIVDSSSGSYELTKTNDLTVRYYHA
jgi:hypothetical protein